VLVSVVVGWAIRRRNSPLSIPLFEEYAATDRCPPAFGGEMSAAIQADDRSTTVGIDRLAGSSDGWDGPYSGASIGPDRGRRAGPTRASTGRTHPTTRHATSAHRFVDPARLWTRFGPRVAPGPLDSRTQPGKTR
jgi:hypothetical protein